MNIQDDAAATDAKSPFDSPRTQTPGSVHVRVKSLSKRSSTLMRSISQKVTTTMSKPEVKEKIMTVDAFALKERPATWAGLVVSIIVAIATLVYLAFIIYQFLTAPATQKADIFWTIGAGPFPAPIYCAALDGCYISNAVSVAYGTSVALNIDPAQQSCIFLPYQAAYYINITYSTSPLDGLSIIWNGTHVDPSLPKGFGAQVNSQTNCVTPGGPSCVGGIMNLKTPIGPGFNLLTYVQTYNYTATGDYSNGQNRKEWFVGKFSNESTPIPGSTPCLTAYPFLASSTDYVQSTLRQNTLYTVQTISKDSLFLVIFGTVGGAYSLFLQFGAILLILITFLISIHEKRVANTRVVADEPRVSPRSLEDEVRSAASLSSNGSINSTTPLTQPLKPTSARSQSRLKNMASENGHPMSEREKSAGAWMGKEEP